MDSERLDNARFLRIFGDRYRVTFNPLKDMGFSPAFLNGFFPIRNMKALRSEIEAAISANKPNQGVKIR